MAIYDSASRGEIEIADMHELHILNAVAKLERQGFVSARQHRFAIETGRAQQIASKSPSKRIDLLLDEIERRKGGVSESQ